MRPATQRTRHTEPGGLRRAFRGLDQVLVRCGDSSGPSLVIPSCHRTFDQGLTSVSCDYGVVVVLDPATCISRSGPERPLPSRLPPSDRPDARPLARRVPQRAARSNLAQGGRRSARRVHRRASRPETPGGRAGRRVHFGFSRRVRRMTPKRRKRRGESVPSPEQDKAEVVRAVLTRREIGVVTSAAAETARDHRHATLLLWPGGRNPTATHFHPAGGSRCGTHPWRRHRQRGIR